MRNISIIDTLYYWANDGVTSVLHMQKFHVKLQLSNILRRYCIHIYTYDADDDYVIRYNKYILVLLHTCRLLNRIARQTPIPYNIECQTNNSGAQQLSVNCI